MRSPVVNAREKYSKKTVDATTESSPTAAGNGVAVVSGDRPSGRTPGEGRFPELPSPGIRGYDMDAAKLPSPRPNGAVDQDGNPHKVTYAASIYPYIANKPDEMDVAVNATFVVLSKSKSWWRVQRDPEGRGNVIIDESRAGWVPSGCFLELAVPPTSALKLEARNIKSSSVLGKALQDFTAGDDTELSIQEGERVRVYKRYNNWSFR
jgi:hypothetical protein